MNIRLIGPIVFGVCTALAAADAMATTLKVSHVRPQGTTADTDVRAFADAVGAGTNGALKFDIFPANALGDYTVVQERVSIGAVEMALQPIATGANRRFQIALLPYLATNWQEAQSAYSKGSPLRETIEQLYGQQDIKVLAAYPLYFGGVSLNKEPTNVGDPEASKGLKLRVPPIKSFQLLADNIGYIGSPLPFSEAFTAVQTGVVDGVIGSGAEGYYASFRDVTKYYVPLNTHFEVWYLLINAETFSKLPAQQQEAIEAAAAGFESARWTAAEADQAVNEQRLVEIGATLITVDAAGLEAHATKARAIVWPEILKDIGESWAKPILESTLAR